MRKPNYLTESQVEQAKELWDAGVPVTSVCRALGISRDLLVERRKDQLASLKKRRIGTGKKPRYPDPTPEEIAERAMAIRSEWSEEERQERLVGAPRLDVIAWD